MSTNPTRGAYTKVINCKTKGKAFTTRQEDDDDESTRTVQAYAVHGKGMWQNFLRSFTDPLYALLDLFDNAVDASWNLPEGRERKILVNVDDFGHQTGICIRNASSDPIAPMNQILEVFRSDKENHASAIGENGVGIKHACANLSDLSFILTKTSDAYSIGILMKDLQKEKPNFPRLVIGKSDSIYDRIKEACMEERWTWGKAFEVYGNGKVTEGIDNICVHFEEMKIGNDWKDSTDVFTIVIPELRQTGHSEKNGEGEGHLLDQFAQKLPQLYIHLNDKIKVQVRDKVIDMAYWEVRLADLTRFEVAIPQGPEKDPKLKLTHAEPPYAHPTVRFWLGFNVYQPSASAHIYYYSRASGRLIKDLADCRSMLNLISGSTDFKQGLTIILDDYNSTLPLNPTKQDLSFAFQQHGETHKTNLNYWLSGITSFFWKYHFEGTGNSSKAKLRMAVTNAVKLFDDAIASKGVHPLSEMEPIRFQNLMWSQKKVPAEDDEGRDASYMKLQVTEPCRKKAKMLKGCDTLVQLSELNLSNQEKRDAKKETKKRRRAPARGASNKKPKVADDSEDEESDETSGSPPPPRRRKQTARKSVNKSWAAAKRQELMVKQKEMTKAKEDEIKVVRKERDKELKELRIEKDKEIKVLQKEKDQLQKEIETAEEKVAELQKALEAAKRAKDAKDEKEKAANHLINFRIKNCETGRTGYIRVPADANRSIHNVLREKKVIEQDQILKFRVDTIQKLKKNEVSVKVGIWDSSKAEGEYSYIYDVDEIKTESTLELFNYLTQDGMESFREKYDPVHLCIFLEEKEIENEKEEDYLF